MPFPLEVLKLVFQTVFQIEAQVHLSSLCSIQCSLHIHKGYETSHYLLHFSEVSNGCLHLPMDDMLIMAQTKEDLLKSYCMIYLPSCKNYFKIKL